MSKRILGLFLVFFLASLFWAADEEKPYNGLNLSLGNLTRLSKAQTRSISP